MLDTVRSRWMGIDSWAGQPLYSLSPAVEEGMALCGIFENGKMSATIAASPAATDTFLGFAFGWYTTPVTSIVVETYTVPVGGGAVVLGSTPLNPTTGINVKTAAGTFVTYNATPGTGVYQASGNTLTFNAAQAGVVVTVTYAMSPTVAQANALVGDGYIGRTQPSDVTGTIGLIRQGIVFVSNFNPAVDYTIINQPLKVGANGIIDPSASGPVIPGHVYEIPSADSPYLGIDFAARK